MKISKHALERYLERIKEMDINEIKKRISEDLDCPGFQKTIKRFGNASFGYKTNGITYCLRGGTVTTCYPSK